MNLPELPENMIDFPVHSSDCAMHNMPAMPNGDCDCGFVELKRYIDNNMGDSK